MNTFLVLTIKQFKDPQRLYKWSKEGFLQLINSMTRWILNLKLPHEKHFKFSFFSFNKNRWQLISIFPCWFNMHWKVKMATTFGGVIWYWIRYELLASWLRCLLCVRKTISLLLLEAYHTFDDNKKRYDHCPNTDKMSWKWMEWTCAPMQLRSFAFSPTGSFQNQNLARKIIH